MKPATNTYLSELSLVIKGIEQMLVELPNLSEANKLMAEITLKRLRREKEELTAQTITLQNLEFFIEMKKQNDLPK